MKLKERNGGRPEELDHGILEDSINTYGPTEHSHIRKRTVVLELKCCKGRKYYFCGMSVSSHHEKYWILVEEISGPL